jgi:hypothetical protein
VICRRHVRPAAARPGADHCAGTDIHSRLGTG